MKITRTRDVNRGRLLPLVEEGGWTFAAIEAESRELGKPVASSVLSRINRGSIPLSPKHAATLALILGVKADALLKAVNAPSKARPSNQEASHAA